MAFNPRLQIIQVLVLVSGRHGRFADWLDEQEAGMKKRDFIININLICLANTKIP